MTATSESDLPEPPLKIMGGGGAFLKIRNQAGFKKPVSSSGVVIGVLQSSYERIT
jgi:hypothetical protein